MSDKKVRVRFAPSPTGPLHMGGVRTALFNYLFAKKHGGEFILRIEDTDQTRFVPGAEDYIIESLNWCGLTPVEGPGIDGDFGPYRQSERKKLYKKYADQLVESGWAYYAFDTAEEIDALRKEAEANKETFSYGIATRDNLNNSLKLSEEEVQQKIAAGEAYVIRFKMPADTDVSEDDLIRGNVTFNTTKSLDDKVLFKSDGMPTYHLANVVDDHLMEISHVIRGEEWLPSMPLHVLLYKALGWEATKPRFAHLPLILKPVGKGKLSKRDGDKLGFPVFPLLWTDPKTGDVSRGYREDGYFPEAFINLLALLGWNPGTEQEFFSLEELGEIFSLERVVKSGSRFDPEKAKWFNKHYFQEKSVDELAELFMPVLAEKGIEASDEKTKAVVAEIKERCEFVADLWDQSSYFFEAPTEYDAKTVKKRWKENTPNQLTEIVNVFETVDNWKADAIKDAFSAFMNEKEWGFGTIMNPLRLALVGGNMGPDLFVICELLGKEESIARIKTAIEKI
ncbi:glutamate--tRNA ligase [Draconibacterium halophilum]|uniref:Glutamate--tRNA ligase n=1 Tax=Draconibacterium halophilum TaxID=2706887 RepID=A0A6C0R807_9BACT|nr:glutamate--tRNA ligase [Draconibacterium halophilum]QIA06330.1 glutamate--tRNA ligase [Draconibacterium halophilum]